MTILNLNNKLFDSSTKDNVEQWLSGPYDDKTKDFILDTLNSNPQELVDAFYTTLSFGTGGLRGIMGIGSNRMNVYTIRAATQGLANYLNQQPLDDRTCHSVFIGFDSRHNSLLFAEESAKVLAGNGIEVYLCEDLRPTPLVSFGCRFKHCSAAIMITASHNPSNYNGYKVYWNDGAQVLPPHDQGIIHEVQKIKSPDQVKSVSIPNALIRIVGEEVDSAYVDAIGSLQLYPEINKKEGQNLKVIFSPFHGTGITLIKPILAKWGFTNLKTVKEQETPDGNFPTVKSPNPEDPEALKLGIELLLAEKGDIFLATDPDADRVGVVVNHFGKAEILNGNQIACICLEHVLETLQQQGKLKQHSACIKTLVTTELFQAIADQYHVACFNVLTGFKYIAEKIRQWEHDPQGYHYLFGGEESFGYLLGTFTRDKDALNTSALLCEAALQAKLKGQTLIDVLFAIYKKYGIYIEKLLNINYGEGKVNREKMVQAMQRMRSETPKTIGGVDILALEDYSNLTRLDVKSGRTSPLVLAKTDMIIFWLVDGTKVVVRPSGTEPKIKVYCGLVYKAVKNENQHIPQSILEGEAKAQKLLEAIRQDLN